MDPRIHKMTGVALEEFPRVQAWYGRVRARPAVDRGVSLLRERWVVVTKSDDAKRNLFRKPSFRRIRIFLRRAGHDLGVHRAHRWRQAGLQRRQAVIRTVRN